MAGHTLNVAYEHLPIPVIVQENQQGLTEVAGSDVMVYELIGRKFNYSMK